VRAGSGVQVPSGTLSAVATVSPPSPHSRLRSSGGTPITAHKSTVSHHMKIMREAGLTPTRAVGRNRYVQLRRDDLDARFPSLLDSLLKSLPD